MHKYLLLALLIGVLLVAGGYLVLRKPISELSSTPEMMNDEGDMMHSIMPAAQSHRSYDVELLSNTNNLQPNQPATLTYKIKNDRGEILKDYATVHEKIMHFIAIRKDLQNFQHLHPDFNPATGEFTVTMTLPADGSYRLFPDFTPAKSADNPQLLPVTVFADLTVGNMARYQPQPVVPDVQVKKTAGEYTVTFAFPKLIVAQTPFTYTLDVGKNGKPVTNLEPYLGALGHSVILKSDTLDFIHTHAEEAKSTKGGSIAFTTSFPEPGTYKIFVQFQHLGKVFTTDYIVSAGKGTTDRMMEEGSSGQHMMGH